MNPNTEPEVMVVGKDFYKEWKLQAKQTAHLGKSMYISNISHRTTNLRPPYVTEEKVKLLTHNIIQTEQKDLKLEVGYTLDDHAFDGNGFLYVYNKNGTTYPLTGNILDIDKEKGLILLNASVSGHNNLRIDYSVDEDAWAESPNINFNPMFSRFSGGLEDIEDNYYNDVSLWYSHTSPGLYYTIEKDDSSKYNFIELGDASQLDNISPANPDFIKSFVKKSHYNLDITEPSYIDIRKEGGKLIDKDHSDDFGPIYDIRSHMSYGFMGVSPEQTNIMVVGVGKDILVPILLKYDSISKVPFVDTYGHTIDHASTTNAELIEYINNYISIVAESSGLTVTNTLLFDLVSSINRYTPLGVPWIAKIGNSDDIIIQLTNTSFETKIAGEYE